MTAVSMDRGLTWQSTYAHFSACSGLSAYARASDPWVAISPGGTAYQISLSLADSNTTSAVLVSQSPDGGFTWNAPITLMSDTLATGFNDKESITADPTDPRYAYAVWDRYPSNANIYSVWFARTANAGAAWEPARLIYNPGTNAFATANQLLVLPDGTVVDIFVLTRGKSASIAALRSTDHGVTWSQPVVVSADDTVGTVNPKTQAALRTGAGIPSAAVDRATGAIYAVWSDARFSGFARDGIALSKSTDGGLTWSQPTQVNQAPNVQAFTPAVAAGAGGVAVTYFDFRKDTSAPATLLASPWRVASTDGGVTWREASVLGPFDLNSAPVTTAGDFIGDYQGLAAAGPDFLAFFAAANSGQPSNPSSIFATSSAQPDGLRDNGRIEINRNPRAYQPEAHRPPPGASGRARRNH